MKKILIAFTLLATSSGAFAQSITFQSHTPGCTFYPQMYAVCAGLGDGVICDLVSFTPTIAFAPAVTYATLTDFNSGPPGTGVGWAYEATPVTAAGWASPLLTANFYWLECSFQYQCAVGCAGNGHLATTSTIPSFTCTGGAIPETLCTVSCAPHYATWTETGSGTYLDNVIIDFY